MYNIIASSVSLVLALLFTASVAKTEGDACFIYSLLVGCSVGVFVNVFSEAIVDKINNCFH